VAWQQIFLLSLRSGLQLAALVALLGVAVPTAALAQTEIDPGETLSNLTADGGNITDDCETVEDPPLRTCLVLIEIDDNRIELLAEAPPGGLEAAAGGNVFKTLTVSSADGAEDGSALIGSFLSMRVDWSGILKGAAGAVARYSIEVQVVDITEEGAPVLVASQVVASEREGEGVVAVGETQTFTLQLPLVRGHTYEIRLQGDARADPSLDEGAEADFFFGLGPRIRWLELSVTAGQDPFEAIADLQSQVDDLAAENAEQDLQIDRLREDFDSHSHVYRTGKGKGHNKAKADTSRPVVQGTPSD